MPLDDAWPAVKRASVFTIHTPVSAGNERFDADLVRRVAGPLFAGEGRPGTGSLPVDDVLALGRGADGDPGQFDMTAFSLRLANGANAVSQLHAETANDTWQGVLGVARDPRRHQRRPHPDLGRPADARALQRYLDADLDDLDGQSDAERASGSASAASPTASCGRRTSTRSWSWRSSPAAGCAPSWPATASRRRRSPSSRRPRPGDPDDRLRPPVRDLQARRARVHGHGPARPPRLRTRTARSSSSSPARRTRPTGPASR